MKVMKLSLIVYLEVLLAIVYGQSNDGSSINDRSGMTFRMHMTDTSELPAKLMESLPANLESLQLAHNKIEKLTKKDFPKGCCKQLSFINLHDNYISHIDDGIFEHLPNLVRIDLSDNLIKKFPNLKAKKLQRIDLQTNLIESINPDAMQYYKKLWHLDVGYNKITKIGADTFEENNELVFLQLRHNPLESISETGLPKNLENLHLENTLLTKLPSDQGIKNLITLTIKNVVTLFTIPEPSKFEKLEKIEVTYSMHCCAFAEKEKYDSALSSSSVMKECNSTLTVPGEFNENPENLKDLNNSTETADNSTTEGSEEPMDPFASNFEFDSTDDNNDDGLTSFIDAVFGTTGPATDLNNSDALCNHFLNKHLDMTLMQTVKCSPAPDAFNPCQDVMGTHTLRAFSWIVSIFAIIGNLFQLVILFYSRQDLTVYKLLMYNLGFGNLLMGVYLLVLCCVDTYTYGKYYNFVQSWQYSGGCQAFGFIAMFASQLSFCSLVLITIERFLLIIFALQVGNQMKLRHAKVAVFITWIYSFIIAALPITGKVSSYSKIAICLPVDNETPVALAYIVWLLLAYIIAFLIIVACYVVMYFNISKVRPGSTSNTIDIQVAKRMALIIFSNFLCWLPISIAGFMALFSGIELNVKVAKFLIVFIFPLNACTNPFLYAIFTKVFRGDTLALLSSCGLCKNAEAKYRNRAPSNYLRAKPKQRSDTTTKHFLHYEPPSQTANYFDRRNIEAQTEFDSPETPIKVMIDPNKGGLSDPPTYDTCMRTEDSKPRSESTRGLLEDHKLPTEATRLRSESNDTCSTGMSVQSTDSEVYNEFSRMIGSVKSENYLS